MCFRQQSLSHGMATHIKDNLNQQGKTHNQSLSIPSWVISRIQNAQPKFIDFILHGRVMTKRAAITHRFHFG